MSSSAAATKVALITGANKGIGYHLISQLANTLGKDWILLLGSRDAARGEEAAKKLALANVQPLHIDIDDQASIAKAAQEVKTKFGGLDLLVNNAGMAFKGDAFDTNVVDTTFKTNYYGTLHALEAFIPLIRPSGKIVNVSSMVSNMTFKKFTPELQKKFTDASLTIPQLTALMQEFRNAVDDGTYEKKGWPKSAYGVSKVGVSALTDVYARELASKGITINAACPGWCRTDMAGDKAPRSAEEGAATIATACLDKTGANGKFWENHGVSSWTKLE